MSNYDFKPVNYLQRFMDLPHLEWGEDKRDGNCLCVKADDLTGYMPNLYHGDGEWHVEWISSEGDTGLAFASPDIKEAITEAWAYCVRIKVINGHYE